MTTEEAKALRFHWQFWAREKQLAPPGDWSVWLVLAGRGFGKTRTGAEWVRQQVESGACKRIALVSDTAADVRDVMIEGPDGILNVFPPSQRPLYEPSKRRITFKNGAVAIAYAAESPELLRGPQHDGAWCDELAKWQNLKKKDTEGGTAWDNLLMGLRIGENPKCVVTTTPRPIPVLKELIKNPDTVVTKGTSYENRDNLSVKWFNTVIKAREGTRLGRQEINAELLDDNPNALWQRTLIEELRVSDVPDLIRIVVGVDPQIADPNRSENDTNDTGIVVVGISKGAKPEAFVLDDMTLNGAPGVWAREAIAAYRKYRADCIVAEVNNGGALVEFTVRAVDDRVSYKAVHAARGKYTRAEPVAALYEQKRVHHVGMFSSLEDEMCEWVPGDDSPDRMDALVWGITELMLEDREMPVATRPSDRYAGIRRVGR